MSVGKSIIIIGAGLGGLAAGCYGQMNGYDVQIFEMHSQPGGQCTAWKKQGYTFDACIHHLFGCKPGDGIYRLWQELGAMPRPLIDIPECTSVVSPEGKMFFDYYDPDKLEKQLNSLSPGDSKVIKEYIKGIKTFTKSDLWGEFMFGSVWGLIKMVPSMPSFIKWFNLTMLQFGERFTDPFLKRAFPLLVYSMPSVPMGLHLTRHAYGYSKAIQWPVGGSLEFSRSIERRFEDLGGVAHFGQKVEKILVENNGAVGIKLADGSEHRADFIISNADGRKTIMNMLEGKYVDKKIESYCVEPEDDSNWAALQVYLGVNRDLSREPSALVILLDKPVTIANQKIESVELQIYGFDKTMAPEGKGVIKVEFTSSYSYWKRLYEDKPSYEVEEKKVAREVIDILGKYFNGIRDQVEVIDVVTLTTWEHFMGGTRGFANAPNKKMSFLTGLFGGGSETTLPGLSNFYFAGVWATSAGATLLNALSGKKIIQKICKMDGKKFLVHS